MLKAAYCRYQLNFNFVAITSRQSMTEKETYFIKVWDTEDPERYGVGECAIFRGLSADDTVDYQSKIAYISDNISQISQPDIKEPSIRFGLETAFNDLHNGGKRIIFPTDWIHQDKGIEINGLVWMGDINTMRSRLREKIADGYRCIKIKIGALDFDSEIELLKLIREEYSERDIQLRLDANGAFTPGNALRYIDRLAKYDIHSLEQPVKPNQWKGMKEICRYSPIPIALDEELIGNMNYDHRCWLLDSILPQYIILKPSLCGGFSTADGWIKDAVDREIGWWATSALESDIGLNAIAQWVSTKNISIPQGLGTGMLYTNNITSPLLVNHSELKYDPNKSWDLSHLQWTN
ncbi:MAG: o-succinylbenzoate synthase [Muribaculaceae bacterium]|nr:o-succinylbenzoate synthase [Muribaculaceae bacterium]